MALGSFEDGRAAAGAAPENAKAATKRGFGKRKSRG
jgi:hypothetical protein